MVVSEKRFGVRRRGKEESGCEGFVRSVEFEIKSFYQN
jgi:hypothetical protein